MQKYKNAIACAIGVGLLLTRTVYYEFVTSVESPADFYVYLQWAIMAVAVWQAVRLFLVDRAVLVAITLCAVAIVANPFVETHITERAYARIYAIMTLPFIAAAVEDILYVRKAKKKQ